MYYTTKCSVRKHLLFSKTSNVCCLQAGDSVLEGGWQGVWRMLLEISGDHTFTLYVLGSSAALLLTHWIAVLLFTVLVRETILALRPVDLISVAPATL